MLLGARPVTVILASLPQSGSYNYYSEITPRLRQACPKVHSGYLHASKLAGYCLLKVGRGSETARSETEDLISAEQAT